MKHLSSEMEMMFKLNGPTSCYLNYVSKSCAISFGSTFPLERPFNVMSPFYLIFIWSVTSFRRSIHTVIVSLKSLQSDSVTLQSDSVTLLFAKPFTFSARVLPTPTLRFWFSLPILICSSSPLGFWPVYRHCCCRDGWNQ